MKRLLSVILTLALALSALAGCEKKYDPQQPESQSSEPESSQAAPERAAPEPIMPVPELDDGGDDDADAQSDDEAGEDEEESDEEEPDGEDADEDADQQGEEEPDADGEDEDGEEGDDEDEEGDEDEEDEDDGLDELGIPAVPHGEELAWLNFSTVTADELRPVINKVLARAEYFCQYGMTSGFTDAGPDPRKEVSIQRRYRTYGDRTYYPYTDLPYHTLDELEDGLMTTFSLNVLTADLYYLFEIMTDDGSRLYYADGVMGLNKARGWDTSDMVIKEATDQRLTLHMTTSWQGEVFDADLTVRMWEGYLVLEPSYFVISEAQQAAMHHTL